MQLKFYNIISSFKEKINYFFKGIYKAYNMSLLPDNIIKIYAHPIIRILRIIGDLSALLVITKKHLLFNFPLDSILIVLALLQFFQIVLISIIKIIYGIKKLLKNPKDFEVCNSPLNQYATDIAKLAYFWKIGCNIASGSVGIIAVPHPKRVGSL
nr:hypothetical protein [Grifola frondosa]